MSIEEINILYTLIAAGSGSENLELTDELLREYQLTPPLEAEVIGRRHIGILGVKFIPFAFQISETISNEEEGQVGMVDLNLTMPKRFVDSSGAASTIAPSSSSRGERLEQTSSQQ